MIFAMSFGCISERLRKKVLSKQGLRCYYSKRRQHLKKNEIYVLYLKKFMIKYIYDQWSITAKEVVKEDGDV